MIVLDTCKQALGVSYRGVSADDRKGDVVTSGLDNATEVCTAIVNSPCRTKAKVKVQVLLIYSRRLASALFSSGALQTGNVFLTTHPFSPDSGTTPRCLS